MSFRHQGHESSFMSFHHQGHEFSLLNCTLSSLPELAVDEKMLNEIKEVTHNN
jgi:hypothetical protein